MDDPRCWTLREITEDLTIPQMTALWFKDEAEGWQTISGPEAIDILRRKAKTQVEDSQNSRTR